MLHIDTIARITAYACNADPQQSQASHSLQVFQEELQTQVISSPIIISRHTLPTAHRIPNASPKGHDHRRIRSLPRSYQIAMPWCRRPCSKYWYILCHSPGKTPCYAMLVVNNKDSPYAFVVWQIKLCRSSKQARTAHHHSVMSCSRAMGMAVTMGMMMVMMPSMSALTTRTFSVLSCLRLGVRSHAPESVAAPCALLALL